MASDLRSAAARYIRSVGGIKLNQGRDTAIKAFSQEVSAVNTESGACAHSYLCDCGVRVVRCDTYTAPAARVAPPSVVRAIRTARRRPGAH